MSSARGENRPYTADNKQVWAWGVGGVANHALIQTFGQINSLFVLGFGLSPLLVGLVGAVPRLFDGIIDPFVGHLSDNTHTRWGRRKPFLVGGAVSAAAFLVGIWWVSRSWNIWAQFGYLLVCTTLFYTCWGIYSMAWTAIGYELTDDYHERSRVQGVAGIFLTGVALVNSWLYWIALRPMFGDGTGQPYQHHGLGLIWEFLVRQFHGDPTVKANEVTGIRWLASILAVISVAAALVCVMVCKERFAQANTRKKHVALLPAMKETLKNRPFLILLLQRGIGLLGGRVCGGVGGILGLYYVCGGDKSLGMGLGALSGTLNMVYGFALMPFMGHFSRLLGKRQALVLGAVLGLVGAVAAPFVTLPGHPYLPFIPGLILAPLLIITSTLGDALLPDICDYDELLHGERREGLFTAVLAFFSKLEMSAAAVGAGAIIAWAGFNKDLPAQSAVTLNRMWWIALIPPILFSLVGLIIVLKFPLTEATMNEVRRQLDERRAAAKQHQPVRSGLAGSSGSSEVTAAAVAANG